MQKTQGIGINHGLNKFASMYSPELRLQLKEILSDYIHFYGYTDAERRITGKTNPTSFFSCKPGEVSEDRINGYKAKNQIHLLKEPQDQKENITKTKPNHLIGRDREVFGTPEALPKIKHEELTIKE